MQEVSNILALRHNDWFFWDVCFNLGLDVCRCRHSSIFVHRDSDIIMHNDAWILFCHKTTGAKLVDVFKLCMTGKANDSSLRPINVCVTQSCSFTDVLDDGQNLVSMFH